ncbi:hypothetical protein HNY73_004405 [Argiope bruennichi]|uniref:Uncharacterized protein n=1 Tax=Argiope bruennichi TaxID=94029 RepID=A0A8T0FPV6_ARGBR|nr:hypothetical protein HNY73_004405 [Argiope bruennichi]
MLPRSAHSRNTLSDPRLMSHLQCTIGLKMVTLDEYALPQLTATGTMESVTSFVSNFKGLPSNQQIGHCGSEGEGLCYCGLCAYFTDKHPRNDTLLTIVLRSVSWSVAPCSKNQLFLCPPEWTCFVELKSRDAVEI